MAMQLAGRRVALAVGIILLAVGTVAVVSIVKQRGEAARDNEMIKIANNDDSEDTSKSGSGTDSNNKDTQKSEENPSEGATSGATEQGADRSTSTPAPQGVNTTPATELPQTGPADYLAAVPLGLITFAAIGYLQSRRLRL